MKIGIDARLISQTGVGRYIKNLIYNLEEIDRKNDYTLFARKEDLNEFGKIKGKFGNWKVVVSDITWHSLEEQSRFKKILEKENLDLVHFPYFSIPIFYNKPYVITIHDLIVHHFPTGKASTLPAPIYWSKLLGYKFVVSQAAKKAKKIIAVSNSTKDEIVDHLKVDPGKIDVIYEGIDRQFTINNSQLTKMAGKKLHKKKYFLFVGNVYPHKNADTLINAFEKLEFKDLRLIFVGKEDYFYERLKQKAKINKNIEFLNYVSDEELLGLYRNAAATVCPAFMEGFGLPALEAMANKCLVIASDIPALHEICQDNAIYFDPKNSEELKNRMIDVLKNRKKFEDKIVGGYKRSQEFSWRKMTKQTLAIYESIL